MKKFLTATLNFFKKKSVQLWALIMVGVCVISFGVMSWIMVANKVSFTHLEFTERVMDASAPGGFIDTQIQFDFIPSLNWVDTITFANNNEDLATSRQLQNNKRFGQTDAVELQGQARIVSNIMDRLNGGRRTNSFTQFSTGGEGNRDLDGRVVNTHTSNWTFEELSGGVWIRIVFVTPQFVVNRDVTGTTTSFPWQIETFNPDYERPRDAQDRPITQALTRNQYNNHIINAIHIPLGNVGNRFTRQTWYLSVGSQSINNTTSMGFTFETYGNYHRLMRYVNNIDNDYLL